MTSNFSTRHVQQVAELVNRLTPDEIQELLRLAPRLQAAPAATGQQDDLIRWAGEQMTQYSDLARPMQADDDFLGDATVADYFARSDTEREQIWADLYAAAIESAPEREVKPDAAVPAG